MSTLTAVPPVLSAPQLFRLVEIAHETANLRLRAAALDILARELAPPVVVAPDPAPDPISQVMARDGVGFPEAVQLVADERANGSERADASQRRVPRPNTRDGAN